MECVKGTPYFIKAKEKIKSYPYLNKDIETDVLIIGGGIDGAIANYYLSQEFNCVLVDEERIGHKCTSCSTAILEYQLDEFAEDLDHEMDEEEIIEVYQMGLYSIKKIEQLLEKLENKCEFALRPSLMFTDKATEISKFKREFNLRISYGLDCDFVHENSDIFPFKIKAGIYCENGGAEFNPYLFTKQMIENSKNQKNIYENTKICEIEDYTTHIIATTNYGNKIKCKKIVYATGFDFSLFKHKYVCDRYVSYSIVTNPINDFGWYNNALIQDNLDPYHYLRILPDNRILIGGEDKLYKEKAIGEKVALKKYKKLYKYLLKLFPELKRKAFVEYNFCGLFATTKNNLGLIGKSQNPNMLYFISSGANGIVNAMYGVEILSDHIKGKKNHLENRFSPSRIFY